MHPSATQMFNVFKSAISLNETNPGFLDAFITAADVCFKCKSIPQNEVLTSINGTLDTLPDNLRRPLIDHVSDLTAALLVGVEANSAKRSDTYENKMLRSQ